MKLKKLGIVRTPNSEPQATVNKTGSLRFNAASARKYDLEVGNYAEIAVDEEAKNKSKLYLILKSRSTSIARKFSGKDRYPTIAMKSVLNELDIDYETNHLTYAIKRQFEHEGEKVLELELIDKSPRN